MLRLSVPLGNGSDEKKYIEGIGSFRENLLRAFKTPSNAFREALRADPANAGALYNFADTLDELGLSRQAAEHFRAYLARDADSEWASHAQQRLEAITS